ncbi:MAG: FliH/SctL family protein [Campylobacterota bacterium]|nr:FliH/SctL family protein [Campylobacterota bacterium]
MNRSNVNSTSKIIKDEKEVTPYQLGTFVSNNVSQNEQMKNVASLNDRNINGKVDPVLAEIKNLQQSIQDIQNKVISIENDGIKGRDLDQQLIDALKNLKHYSTFFEQATFQMETKILKTSLSIAQKIIAIEVGENSALIAKETITSMMDKIKNSSKVIIHLNPKDYIVLKDELKFDTYVTLQEDPNVTAGGVVIASDLGNFDGNIESKIQTMLESLDAVL